ncbi:hypothetical protein K1X12_06110 [Hyphomonas sp. WL0036]|uniref:hypothetical protein n=1 Tax=Hyphomonas sediminis TaxID=2866160 RepID=UPI001C8144C4|nr:hypothetical protein [Hyphomonas sediminis]MBY9066463.1 hypothetical protein [Hyphomonas sediminis]
MRCASSILALLLGTLAACSQAEPEVVVPIGPPVPSESLTQAPQVPEPVELSTEAADMKAEILRHAERGALRSLARLADKQEGFISNVGGQDHYEFWDLLRRTGVDPNRKIRELFLEPPGEREVDGEIWFVWPDLAAKDSRDLIPEKLTFVERRRLRELIGEDGIARIRAGEGYPGMRAAISANGRWIYFVLGQDGED